MNENITQNLDALIAKAPEVAITYGTKILFAIVIFIIGKWLAKLAVNFLSKAMTIRGIDETVGKFTQNIVYYVLMIMITIAVLGQLGVRTASFVAMVGAAGLAIGFALQGSLANFAAGILLILLRPFKVDDFVEAGGTAGIVKEVSIFSTILTTPDNKTITISNSSIMGSNIINYSTEEERRVDIMIRVSYSADLSAVRKTLEAIAAEETRISRPDEISVIVVELAESSVNLSFRVWVNAIDCWAVLFDLNEKVKNGLDAAGIEIAYPRMNVHIKQGQLPT